MDLWGQKGNLHGRAGGYLSCLTSLGAAACRLLLGASSREGELEPTRKTDPLASSEQACQGQAGELSLSPLCRGQDAGLCSVILPFSAPSSDLLALSHKGLPLHHPLLLHVPRQSPHVQDSKEKSLDLFFFFFLFFFLSPTFLSSASSLSVFSALLPPPNLSLPICKLMEAVEEARGSRIEESSLLTPACGFSFYSIRFPLTLQKGEGRIGKVKSAQTPLLPGTPKITVF